MSHKVDSNYNGDKRTYGWATHLNIDDKMPTTEHIHQHLALVKPDWGERNAYSVIKIPKGEQVTFISGKAAYKESKTFEPFAGGGYQVRLREFDEKWIEYSADLNK